VQRSPIRLNDPALKNYLILKLRAKPLEELHVIFLDQTRRFLGEELIAQGSERLVIAPLWPIFRKAVALDAKFMILFHNHPSRCPEPSTADIAATTLVVQSAAILGLAVLDHVIVAGNSTTSFKERGLL
jgi:DNA repair protein RadC